MPSSDYEEILESLQKIVRQAYDLGRAEALKQVVEVLKTDPVPPKPLALPAPAPPADEPHRTEPEPMPAMATHDAAPKAMPDASMDVLATPAKTPDAPARDENAPRQPWWAR